jgi:predicted metal-dependent peptidase
MDDPAEKLMAARCRLLAVEPFYGHMGMHITWKPSEMSWVPKGQTKTMGVIARNSRIECLWSREFVNSRTVEQLYGCVQHEIEHLIRLHLTRYRAKYIPTVWNLAVDMCVNGRKSSPRIGCTSTEKHVLPIDEKEEGEMSWIPQDWPDQETAEFYYEKIMEDDRFKWAKEGGCYAGMIDDHTMWRDSEMSPDDVRQLVHDTVSKAMARCQGHIPRHLAGILEKLADPIVSWRHILRNFLGRHLGNRRKTYTRRDRRRDKFGMPGISHHASAIASVVVDTSGSISQEDLEQFFAEIEAIAYRTKVCVLQWDHAFQDFWPRYRRSDWKKIKIKGRGGTDMAAPVQWLAENKSVGNLCVVLTDGYCNYSPPRPFPMLTCITTKDGSEPEWGQIVHMTK